MVTEANSLEGSAPSGVGAPLRIIPRLDIKGPNLVKGVHLEGLRVLGKPDEFARHYYESGADELIYIDVVASLYGRNSLLHTVKQTAREIFIPLTVGGGLRTLDDIRTVLRAGADRVALNTAAIQNPSFVRDAARKFGASTVVVSIEGVRQSDGSYEAYVDNGREPTGVNVLEWAVRAAELGAGELLVTSIDREGTGEGFDLSLTRQITEAVPIQVIACGGAGRIEHVHDVIVDGRADAVALASMLHYEYALTRPVDNDFSGEGNIEYLRSGRGFGRVYGATLGEIKTWLHERDIVCRHEDPIRA